MIQVYFELLKMMLKKPDPFQWADFTFPSELYSWGWEIIWYRDSILAGYTQQANINRFKSDIVHVTYFYFQVRRESGGKIEGTEEEKTGLCMEKEWHNMTFASKHEQLWEIK